MRASLNISLPESMKAWVDEQVQAGGFGTVSEFFRQLVREAQQHRVREEIDRKLLAALESGEPIPVDEKFWRERRRELEKRIKRHKLSRKAQQGVEVR